MGWNTRYTLGQTPMTPPPLQLYAVGGVGVMAGDTPFDEYQLNGAFRLGGGFDYYLTEKLAVTVGTEWITGTGYWSDTAYVKISTGVQYNF